MEFIYQGDPIDEPDVVAIEKHFGMRFPASYRDFLLEYNGGRPAEPDFYEDPVDELPLIGVERFYSIAPEHLNLENAFNTFWKRMPDELYAIGSAVGGNQICLNMQEGHAQYGRVFLWIQELEADEDQDEVVDYSNVRELADDFAAFVVELRPED